MPKNGSSNESFSISGHHFSYSDYDELELTPCFNKTALNGGPIRSGMLVRVKFRLYFASRLPGPHLQASFRRVELA